MSQCIAAYRVKDRPVLVLFGYPAGRPVRRVSVFVADRNGHSARRLIPYLDHAVGIEKREGRRFDQFPQRLRTGLDEKIGGGKMPFADIHPETDLSRNQNTRPAHLRKGDAFLFGKGMLLVHGKADLLIHVTLAVKRFIVRKGMQDNEVISAVFQEASVTLDRRKIYWQDMDKANQSPEIAKRIYGSAPVHRMFIREVEYTI